MLLRLKEILDLVKDINALSYEDGLEILNEESTAAVFSPIKVGRNLEAIRRKTEEITVIILKIGEYYKKRDKTND
ncbi:MAG: hypothetical protein [Asgard archaea virus SkuldV2]|nr:MAG: hypothetical protein [Asgard archaea virus SkuldV2]